MREQLKELLNFLSDKNDKNDLTTYEEGMLDLLGIIIDEDGYALDEIIQEYKDN